MLWGSGPRTTSHAPRATNEQRWPVGFQDPSEVRLGFPHACSRSLYKVKTTSWIAKCSCFIKVIRVALLVVALQVGYSPAQMLSSSNALQLSLSQSLSYILSQPLVMITKIGTGRNNNSSNVIYYQNKWVFPVLVNYHDMCCTGTGRSSKQHEKWQRFK